jgi:hypothetical protein
MGSSLGWRRATGVDGVCGAGIQAVRQAGEVGAHGVQLAGEQRSCLVSVLGKTERSRSGQHRLGRGEYGRGHRWGTGACLWGATIPGWYRCAGVGPSRAKRTPPGRRARTSVQSSEGGIHPTLARRRRRGPLPTPLRGQPDVPRGPRDAGQPGDASPWSAWARKLAVGDQYQHVPTLECRRPSLASRSMRHSISTRGHVRVISFSISRLRATGARPCGWARSVWQSRVRARGPLPRPCVRKAPAPGSG